ncbi:hypothetical protein MMC27_005189 [Xylographa pallens]|nr:hypothetical protein [Xylographa pallens]
MSHFVLDKAYVYIAVFEDVEDANGYAKAWLQDSWSLDEDSFDVHEDSYSEDGTLLIRAFEEEGDVFEIRVLKKEYRTARKAQVNST